MPKGQRGEMPATILRSSSKAQRTWQKAHDSAVLQYGEGERAHRTAYAALKHTFEKRGNRWVAKSKPGPSDPRSKEATSRAHVGVGKTYGGIDYYGHTKRELLDRARELDIRGRWRMDKDELAEAIARKQR